MYKNNKLHILWSHQTKKKHSHKNPNGLVNFITIWPEDLLPVGLLISRKTDDKSPSVQSRVFGSKTPYSSMTDIAFGLIVYSFVVSPNFVWKIKINVYITFALPLPNPWYLFHVNYFVLYVNVRDYAQKLAFSINVLVIFIIHNIMTKVV